MLSYIYAHPIQSGIKYSHGVKRAVVHEVDVCPLRLQSREVGTRYRIGGDNLPGLQAEVSFHCAQRRIERDFSRSLEFVQLGRQLRNARRAPKLGELAQAANQANRLYSYIEVVRGTIPAAMNWSLAIMRN